MKKYLWLLITVCASLFLAACGGGSSTPPPPVATHLVIMGPAAAPAVGNAFNVTVSALDVSGALVATYSGTVHFTSSDALAVLPNDSPLTGGTKSFSVTFKTAGSQTITATDAASSSITGTSLPIAVQALFISSGPLPNGILQAQYGFPQRVRVPGTSRYINGSFFKLTASGGTGSYSWSWGAAAGSSLPPGLTCCEEFVRSDCEPNNFCKTVVEVTDAVSGVPTKLGTYNVVVTVKDAATPTNIGSANYTIVVGNPPPPVMNITPTPPIATLNSPYVGFQSTATGGLLQYTAWTETGALPPGMAFDSASGKLSGTPTASGSFPITIKVTDSAGQDSMPQDFTLQVLATGFKPTGSMTTPRVAHTATLLCDLAALPCNNPKVLVTGFGATADLFDPASGTFTLTGSMSTSLSSSTATLLKDGKVLVTGGEESTNAVATAELFDPASGTFSPTGSMGTARFSHTATLLNDGRVLVTGGLPGEQGIAIATAEIFDPSSGLFTPTGSMEAGRYSHTATLLKDGTILVVGSFVSATAELFDPASGTFAPTGNLGTQRFRHSATLLNDGRVLVAGGQGGSGNTQLASAELFDPATKTFSATASMATARISHTATLLANDTVLVAGGLSFGGVTSSAEIFDPVARTFSVTADMTSARQSHTATLLANGEVLVTGGTNNVFGTLASAELYH